MESRQRDVDETAASTFEWIWKDKTFLEWDAESSGVFWVLGKPGSGKSTFIKYVLDGFIKHRSTGSTLKPTIASFFFHNRGENLREAFFKPLSTKYSLKTLHFSDVFFPSTKRLRKDLVVMKRYNGSCLQCPRY